MTEEEFDETTQMFSLPAQEAASEYWDVFGDDGWDDIEDMLEMFDM